MPTMPVDNNEIQSFIANSSVAPDEFARINTISRWYANKVQPSITQLNEITTILDVDIKDLLNSNR